MTTGRLCSSFIGILTKCGRPQDDILARVNTRLKHVYQVDNPIQHAIHAIQPMLFYKTIQGKKESVPSVINDSRQVRLAIRWIVEAASKRRYGNGKKRDLEKSLLDEIVAILNGSSSLYAKRYNYHKGI